VLQLLDGIGPTTAGKTLDQTAGQHPVDAVRASDLYRRLVRAQDMACRHSCRTIRRASCHDDR
jgi:hypothetical protein